MFEIGFSELVVIMVVALVVIGPERLPKVARTMGHLWGRTQRYVNGVRADIERDMQMEELRQLKLKLEQEAAAVEQSAKQAAQSADNQMRSLEVPDEPAPVMQAKLRSVPAVGSTPKQSAVPEQQQFPID